MFTYHKLSCTKNCYQVIQEGFLLFRYFLICRKCHISSWIGQSGNTTAVPLCLVKDQPSFLVKIHTVWHNTLQVKCLNVLCHSISHYKYVHHNHLQILRCDLQKLLSCYFSIWFKSSVYIIYPNIVVSYVVGDVSGEATEYDEKGIGELLEGWEGGGSLLFTDFRHFCSSTSCPSLKNDILVLIKVVAFNKSSKGSTYWWNMLYPATRFITFRIPTLPKL